GGVETETQLAARAPGRSSRDGASRARTCVGAIHLARGRAALSGDLRGMSLLQGAARKTAGLLGRESWLVRRLRPTYESLLDWLSDGRGIAWPINGVTYRIDPHVRHRLGQNYDAPVAAFLSARVKPGAVCVDVGANVGVYVLQFARWSGPKGRVVAFEPNP